MCVPQCVIPVTNVIGQTRLEYLHPVRPDKERPIDVLNVSRVVPKHNRRDIGEEAVISIGISRKQLLPLINDRIIASREVVPLLYP